MANDNSRIDSGVSLGSNPVQGNSQSNPVTIGAVGGSSGGATNPYGAPDGDSSWNPSYSYAGSHHYYVEDLPRPSGGGSSYGDSGGWDSILGNLGYGAKVSSGSVNAADPRTPYDKWNEAMQPNPDATRSLYNGDAALEANQALLKNAGLDAGPAKVGRVDRVDTVREENMLNQIAQAQAQQAELRTDNTVRQETADLQRNMQDAQSQFQTMRDQVDVDEQRARDNQALYSEARGDRGGIGLAQYNTIQNTAATNRLTVQKEQTKLATDTARQISDLRAQGEFEKANQLLSITQNYLSQLMDLYTWAKETNVGIDEFNVQVDEWEENYKMSLLGAEIDVANATGVFSNGAPTFNTWMKTQEMLAAAGQAMMQQGLTPTAEQLQAMGWTKDQMMDYYVKHFGAGPTDQTSAERDANGNFTGNIINVRTGEVVRTFDPTTANSEKGRAVVNAGTGAVRTGGYGGSVIDSIAKVANARVGR